MHMGNETFAAWYPALSNPAAENLETYDPRKLKVLFLASER
jgi:hypothetical protein